MNLLPDALALPPTEVIVDRLPSRQVFRQVTPDTPIVDLVENSIKDFPFIDFTLSSPTYPGWRQ